MSKRIPKTIISFEHNYYLDEDVFKMINKLEQENKQLNSILTELEEYMKENEGMYILNAINKLQELKEKYKE